MTLRPTLGFLVVLLAAVAAANDASAQPCSAPETAKVPPAESRLTVRGKRVICIDHAEDLTRALRGPITELGSGEMGTVYGFDGVARVLKVARDDLGVADETRSFECLSRHIAAARIDDEPVFPPGLVIPVVDTRVHLENGETVPATIKPRVTGRTLDWIRGDDVDHGKVKAAMSELMKTLVMYSASREPAFFVNDFKLTNLMWGRIHGEATDHLILIDLNCFDRESDLTTYAHEASLTESETARRRVWSDHYAQMLVGRTPAYNWTVRYDCFDLRSLPELHEAYFAKLRTMRSSFPNKYFCDPDNPRY